MKKFNQLVRELPSNTVVFAFGRFNPPTSGHELLVKAVKKIAKMHNASHAIYASKSQDAKKNPLSVEKKVHYLNLMFPDTHFVAASATVRTFIEAAKELNKKYKNLIMIAGSDRVPEYEKLLTRYNGQEFHFDSVQVVSAGERDPDSDDASGMSASKMRALASKGDYAQFKKGLPSSMRDMDGRRLMNDVRQGMGLDVVKEQVKFTVDAIREKYHKGKIFHIGQFVESGGSTYEILDRGANYLTVVDSVGNTHRKWLHDVVLAKGRIKEDVPVGYAPNEITFKGYTTKNFHHVPEAAKAFTQTIERAGEADPIAVLNAIKATDTYMGLNDAHIGYGEAPQPDEVSEWKAAHDKAKESLDRVGEFMHHMDYWHMHQHELEAMLGDFAETGQSEFQESSEEDMHEELTNKTLKSTDKIKVARMIATMLGTENAEASSSPEQLVNSALRKVKNKALNAEALKILDNMLQLATDVGIKFDGTLKPQKLKEENDEDVVGKERNHRMKVGHTLHPASHSDHARIAKVKKQLGEKAITGKAVKLPDDSQMLGVASQAQDGFVNNTPAMPRVHTPEEDDFDNSDDFDDAIEKMSDDDYYDAYEDDEFSLVDDDTGEEIEDDEEDKKIKESTLMEVLSRAERIRARVRLAKSKSKRDRSIRISLKRYSAPSVINKRARRLAIKLIKQRMVRGRDINKLSVGEKERIERTLEKRKDTINRVAMKLAPRVRKMEKARLSHTKYTQSTPSVAM
jgi:nicotinic acid mononucleotide adenylyltransferase